MLTVALSSNELYIETNVNVNIIPIEDVKFHEFIGSGEFAGMSANFFTISKSPSIKDLKPSIFLNLVT